jgi:hypothetical protein
MRGHLCLLSEFVIAPASDKSMLAVVLNLYNINKQFVPQIKKKDHQKTQHYSSIVASLDSSTTSRSMPSESFVFETGKGRSELVEEL